jgi:ComF family protein
LEDGRRWLCDGCDRVVAAGVGPRLRRIDLGPRGWLDAGCALDYGPEVASLVWEMKYAGKPGIARYLAELLWGAVGGGIAAGSVIVPVPMHAARRRERGYNQAEELGRHLAALAGLGLEARALEKRGNTRCQATLARRARLANVAGSIRAGDARGLRGRPVLLVDDVLTTGSTLRACAVALMDEGVEDVSACAVAVSA